MMRLFCLYFINLSGVARLFSVNLLLDVLWISAVIDKSEGL